MRKAFTITYRIVLSVSLFSFLLFQLMLINKTSISTLCIKVKSKNMYKMLHTQCILKDVIKKKTNMISSNEYFSCFILNFHYHPFFHPSCSNLLQLVDTEITLSNKSVQFSIHLEGDTRNHNLKTRTKRQSRIYALFHVSFF